MKSSIKIFIGTLVMSIISIITFTSCSDETEFIEPRINQEKNIVIGSPQFAENPYDSIGLMHNYLLSELDKRYRVGMSIPQHYEQTLQLYVDIYGPNITMADFEKLMPLDTLMAILNHNSADYSSLLNTMDLSPASLNVINSCIEIIKTEQNYLNLKNELIAIERDIISKEIELPQSEEPIILSALSIGRYSAFYWLSQKPKASSVKPNWWLIVSDCVGGIVGGLSGAVTVVGVAIQVVAIATSFSNFANILQKNGFPGGNTDTIPQSDTINKCIN